VTLAPYTWTILRWISAGDVPFSRRNLITLRTSMFDHVSASPAILHLMLGQYGWYEARSSVRERKQCSTCYDLAGNLNEIRNITQVRGRIMIFGVINFLFEWICQWTIWSFWLWDAHITTANPFHFPNVIVGVCIPASEFSAGLPWWHCKSICLWHLPELTNLFYVYRDRNWQNTAWLHTARR
jgi:hypothetical protein